MTRLIRIVKNRSWENENVIHDGGFYMKFEFLSVKNVLEVKYLIKVHESFKYESNKSFCKAVPEAY